MLAQPQTETRPVGAAARGAAWAEAGLCLSVLSVPALLALVPHGAAPLAGFAALCAAAMVAADRSLRTASLRLPAALLVALLVWGLLSAAWSIDPQRSLIMAMRLTGLFAAALALAAATSRVAAPGRLTLFLLAGTALGIAVAVYDLATEGGLSRYVSVRDFTAPRLNQVAAWIAIVLLPVGALLIGRGRLLLGLLAMGAMAAAVFLLADTTAKIALLLSLPIAALLYARRCLVARIAAAATALAILTAPVTLPRLAHDPALFAAVDGFKTSAGHRLLIWCFTGDRIAERPLLGWGLDSARAIPGGKELIRPGQSWLPLHPHDAALQVWLELGAPGAVLFAALAALLWLRLGDAPWPRLYAAAGGGSLAAAWAIALSGWGVWQEWWLGTLALAAFAIMVMARSAGEPNDRSSGGSRSLPVHSPDR